MNGSAVTNGNSYSGTQYHSPAVFETDSLQKKKQNGKFFSTTLDNRNSYNTNFIYSKDIIMVPGYIYSVTVATFQCPKLHIPRS